VLLNLLLLLYSAQVNHLSQFYLTNHLLPLIKNAAQNKINNFVPRIVVVASDAIGAGKVNISYWKKEGKDKLPYFLARYADTKLALCIVSKKWAEEVESDGIVVHFLHPGVVYTGKYSMFIFIFKTHL
jgi:NAD(P)-dependent dehydrogenase (short-subunit alcohol dehydrogenase family)